MVAVEEAEHREGIEKLLFGLVDEIVAVGIQHLAVARQHIHHLEHVIGGVLQQGATRQQASPPDRRGWACRRCR